jgi:hypothetical protein
MTRLPSSTRSTCCAETQGNESDPASGCCSPWLVTGREEGFNGNRNQPNFLSTMEHSKVEIGAKILVPIIREFGEQY